MRHWLFWTLVLVLLTTACSGKGVARSSRASAHVATSAAALVVVDDTQGSPTDLSQFGPDATATYGQVVTVPAGDPLLVRFGVLMLGVPSSVVFRGEVFAWDGAKATGPSLYESAPTSTAGAATELVTFDTGNLTLTTGSEYVLFVSTSRDAGSGAGDIAGQPGASYTGGAVFFLDSGSDPTAWTTESWSQFQQDADLAFTATFDAFASTTALVSSEAPSSYGQSVTFTATVLGTETTPDGTVTFRDGTTSLGAAALDGSGKAAFTTALLGAGPHTITAAYAGSSVYDPSASTALSQVVDPASSTTVVTASTSPAVVGNAVTFTAKVARLGAGDGVPSGTVTFLDGSTTLGTDALDGSGVATFSAGALDVGTHTIRATYGGDANFTGGTSPAFTEVVNADGVTVTLVSPENPSTYRATVSFQATVVSRGPNSGTPTGTVTFKDSAALLGASPVGADGTATFATTALSGGSHAITATYGGDTNHSAATASLQQIISPTDSTTAIASTTNPVVFGQSVTLTATVNGAGTTPTGAVTFRDGTTALGSSALTSAGQASLTLPALAVGTRALTAVYAGDANYRTSASAALQEQVNRAATTTNLTASSTPSVVGGPVTFTASVAVSAPGAGTPTGAVTFRDGVTVLGSGTLNTAGIATFQTRTLAANTHTIAADYAGDTRFGPSTSPSLSQVVNQDGASVSLTASANPSFFGASVTFTAKVSSDGTGGSPTGNLTFRDGTAVLSTGALNAASVATFVTGSLAGGPHTISATYAGDANHEGGILGTLIQVVDPAPTTVTLASSANPAIFGQRLTLTATAASGPMAPFSGTVTFLNGAVALGTSSIDASGKATLSVSSLGIATHALRAVFGGDLSHAASTSAALSEVVGVVQTKTALASSSNPAVVGKTLTFTATVSPVAPGAGLPTGMVTFSDGKTAFGGAVLDENGVASLDTGSLDEGAHTITAAYGGDGTYGPSKSDALTQRLAVQVTTVVVTSSPSPSTFGASVVLTATVDGSVATPTGKVTFRDGTTALGDASLDASGAASFSTTTLDVGTHTLSAEYAGDGANTAVSGTVSQMVGAAVTTTAVVSDEIRSFAGEAVTFTATVTSEVTGFSGDVEFLDGTASLGVVSLSGSTATLQTAALAQGGHAITAAYKGDARFAPSTSEALTETVQASLSTAGDAGVGRDAGTRGELPADAGPPAEGGAATRKDPFLRDTGSGCDCRLEPASRARGESSLAAVVLATLLTLRRRRKARDN